MTRENIYEKVATKEERKVKAVEIMKEMDIYKPYISGFKKDDNVCFFENFGGFWAYQDEELNAKIKEVEQKYKCTVYAVTHEFTDYGELYDLLIVSTYQFEWERVIRNGKYHIAFAYVWNKTDDLCSEFGQVYVDSFAGGIKRVG